MSDNENSNPATPVNPLDGAGTQGADSAPAKPAAPVTPVASAESVEPISGTNDACDCACSGGECSGCGNDADGSSCGGCDGECGHDAGGDDEVAQTADPEAGITDQETATHLVTVRYGMMAVQGDFLTDVPDLRTGDMVIMKTDRGIDHGIVAKKPLPVPPGCRGFERIIRRATESDHNILNHIKASKEPEELKHCHERIAERGLPMKLAGIEHLFGGDKVIFYFLADGRVDFRELVKDLARRYRTRIEMRQIGVRDEAKMLSDYEHCGRELCCRTFMRELEPVTMRMAKIQKSTLDPSKISGHCGRLMCCLRFEDDVYKEHKKTLPHRNDTVRTANLSGRVVNAEILSQLVEIEQYDGTRLKIHVDEIVERTQGGGGDDDDGQERRSRDNGPRGGDNRQGGDRGNRGGRDGGGRDNRDRGARGSREGGNRENRDGNRGGKENREGRGNREGRENRDNRGGASGASGAGGASGEAGGSGSGGNTGGSASTDGASGGQGEQA